MTIRFGLVLLGLVALSLQRNFTETLECIKEKATDVSGICGKKNRTMGCESAFISIHVCLLNNACDNISSAL